MKKVFLFKYFITIGVLHLICGVTFFFLDLIKIEILFHFVTLAYSFCVYGLLRIKIDLNKEISTRALDISLFIYSIACIFNIIVNLYNYLENNSFKLAGFLTYTNIFLMIFITIIIFQIKYLQNLKK